MQPEASIGRGELDVLRYVMDHHPITVREVADHMAQAKGHTRTTVLNMMERLREKGYLLREKQEGVYRYSPAISQAQLLGSLVRDFVKNVLGGSLEPVVAYMAQEGRLSDDERQELEQIVEKMASQEREAQP